MKKVGNKRILFNETFISSINEKIKFRVEDELEEEVTIRFEEEEHPSKAAAAWITSEDNGMEITFYGITSTLGHRIAQEQVVFGTLGGKDLSFSIAIHRNERSVLMHVQFMLEI